MRIRNFVTMLVLASAAFATTACASTGMASGDDTPRAERNTNDDGRVRGGYY